MIDSADVTSRLTATGVDRMCTNAATDWVLAATGLAQCIQVTWHG